MNARDHLFLFLARHSWRFYRMASYDVVLPGNGNRIKVPIHHGLGLAHLKRTQSWMERVVMRTYTVRSGVFVDVGANIGQTLLAVQSVQPGVPYLAIEPDPEACRYLERLAAVNHWHQVTVLPQALGAREELLDLHHGATADVSASLVEAFRPSGFFSLTTKVRVERGDDLLERLGAGPIGMLKIDVEGGELEVVEGMEARISADRPTLVFEVLGYGPILSGRVFSDIAESERARIVAFRRDRTHALEDRLRRHGYRFARILENGDEQPADTLDLGPEGEAECNFAAHPPTAASR